MENIEYFHAIFSIMSFFFLNAKNWPKLKTLKWFDHTGCFQDQAGTRIDTWTNGLYGFMQNFSHCT